MHDIAIDTLRTPDIDQVVSLLDRELPTEHISTADFQRKVLLDANFRREGAFVARSGDKIIGFLLSIKRRYPLEDAPPDFDRGWITLLAVDRQFQRRGVGKSLLEAAILYLEGLGAKSIWISPYAPNYFCPGIDEAAYPGAIEFFGKHGFEASFRPLSMEAELDRIEVPSWAEEDESELRARGVGFHSLSQEHILPLLDFVRAEFPGDWQRLVRESIEAIIVDKAHEGALFVAMRGGRCVGFCRRQGERFGPFGVAASERGQGVGAALLFRCLKEMKESGLHRAWFLWTDDRAARIYQRTGFHETRRYSVMKRSL